MRSTLNVSVLIFLGGIFKKKRIFAQILLGRIEKVTMEKGERNIETMSPVNSGL